MKSIINFAILATVASSPALASDAAASHHRFNPLSFFNNIINPRSSAPAAPPNPVLQLLYIAPDSANCTGADFPSECAVSNTTTVAAIVNGFAQYGVTNVDAQVAILSWMAFESAEFKYNQNHFPVPGKPGQGTRCMMSPTFVQEFAQSIPAVQTEMGGVTDPAKILALVQPDQHSFAAASWYYSNKCTEAQKATIRAGGQANWASAFITGCVQTAMSDDRVTYWKRACEALGVTPAA